MKRLKDVFGGNIQQYTMVLALLVLIVIFQITSDGKMLTPSNFQNLISGNAYVLILAIGMVMVIVIGQIDLSVGSVAGLVGMTVAISIRDFGVPWLVGLLIGLVVGIAIGSWQGFWLAHMGIPGFITTLAGLMAFRGVVIWISGSISVPVPNEFSFFGAGYLPNGDLHSRASITPPSYWASSVLPTSPGRSSAIMPRQSSVARICPSGSPSLARSSLLSPLDT